MQLFSISRKACATLMVAVIPAFLITSCGNPDKDASSDKKSQNTSGKSASSEAITLPVLDALFFEENFEQELKTKLQLTDKQITQLKESARASVSDLDESDGEYLGSNKTAVQLSKSRITEIIGEEKTSRLYQLAAERYAQGDIAGLWPTKPNSIPADTRIVVNAPAFRMDVFDNGKLIKSYKVGIGYPEFPLPTGMRRTEQIILNPTWTPPDEPWVKGKVQAGKKVPAGSKLNPLGPIKIPIGLPSLIHGGKAVEKLGTFASHGCVGLTDAQVKEFASLLGQLCETVLPADSIAAIGQEKTKTRTVRLTKAIPVELRYETVVVENGNLHLYRDVYERGTNTMEEVAKVLAIYNLKMESLSAEERAKIEQGIAAMNRDAKGNEVADDTATGKDKNSNKKSSGSKVTRTIAGKKEIIIPIAKLNGKGYPAAVSLNEGK